MPFGDRIPKVIALGAVNPVNDPTVRDPAELRDYINFYANQVWTHHWRRMLVEQEGALAEVMDSHLPHFPKTKDYAYDAVAMLNQYALFANDEGLMQFPPARTYEGTAAGAVMVSSDHACYAELGFVDGVNCIMHRRHNVAEFQEKVQFYRQRPEQLAAIAEASVTMVRERYSHPAVARQLYGDIVQIYDRGQ
ncbi:MAG: glycosyltransferase family 1 protein [Oscillatoriales cyanobacterium SM2_2_1]|nr:glycosyltransferase family 1 protein [Oscillatoriales cyanobacterium SM2_2_1]